MACSTCGGKKQSLPQPKKAQTIKRASPSLRGSQFSGFGTPKVKMSFGSRKR